VDIGVVDEYKFIHPKDIQDGKVEVTQNDVLANVPYTPGCGLWFDHHSSEKTRLQLHDKFQFKGKSAIVPSCARVIFDYFGGPNKFAKFEDNGLMEAVDRSDSGQLTIEDVMNPTGWILLSFIMDPRTGLGRYKDYRISNYRLMEDMIQYCRTMSAKEILLIPDVRERVERYFQQEESYEKMILTNSKVDENVLIIDLLRADEILSGNRFKEYALFPNQNISLRIMWGLKKQNIVFSCGHSIFNRSSMINVGDLMLQYGGGGHTRVGTCQVPASNWKQNRDDLVAALKGEPVPA
jgi:hypothetical protein